MAKRAIDLRPRMSHLLGFWQAHNWDDAKWQVYQARRRTVWQRLQNRIDQAGHWWLGRLILNRQQWEEREAAQWPSKTGSYDPCEDHIHYLRGAGFHDEATLLKLEAQCRRPEFLR